MHGLPASCGDGALTPTGTAQLRGRLLLLMSIVAAVVLVDQVVKAVVLDVLEPGRLVPLLGPSIGWQLVFNPGAAFGLRLPPVIFPLVTLVLAVVVVRALDAATPRFLILGQGLVVGGAIGNVIDRVVRSDDGSWIGGSVVDFVAWGSFPRFNVADASITVGVALFLLAALLEERAQRGSDAPS